MSNYRKEKLDKRRRRVRSKIFGSKDKPRLSVFRSNDHIYAQIVNDDKGVTLASAVDAEIIAKGNTKKASKPKVKKMTKKEIAQKVGELIASKAAKKKIKKVVFDRGGHRYHGRVAALADGARKGGLVF